MTDKPKLRAKDAPDLARSPGMIRFVSRISLPKKNV